MLKKSLMLSLILVILATSIVFADGEQSILSKVTGLTDQEITAINQNHRGFGRIITASIVSKLTNTSIQDVLAANEQGKSFIEIAKAGGVNQEQYQKAIIDAKSAYIDEQVKAGVLTADQGKAIKERMTQNIQNCDGQGLNRRGGCFNGGAGVGMGRGIRGNGNGAGTGMGNGFKGNGLRFGNNL